MAVTASEARKNLFPLIEKVNEDRTAIEITSRRGDHCDVTARTSPAMPQGRQASVYLPTSSLRGAPPCLMIGQREPQAPGAEGGSGQSWPRPAAHPLADGQVPGAPGGRAPGPHQAGRAFTRPRRLVVPPRRW
jgi:hypothetical protein